MTIKVHVPVLWRKQKATCYKVQICIYALLMWKVSLLIQSMHNEPNLDYKLHPCVPYDESLPIPTAPADWTCSDNDNTDNKDDYWSSDRTPYLISQEEELHDLVKYPHLSRAQELL